MGLAVGVLAGIAVALVVIAAWRLIRGARAARTPEALGMQSALYAATATLPHLRQGLSMSSAARALPHLQALTGAAAIALADRRSVLAIEGEGREQVRPGDLLSRLLERAADARVRVEPRLVPPAPGSPRRPAVLAPITVQGKRAGTLIAFYRDVGRPSHHEIRVVQEAAS